MHEPTLKMIITACGNAYVKDSTYIVPVNVLTGGLFVNS